MLGLRRGPSYPVTHKGVEHFAQSGENGIELRPDVLFLVCSIESDRGHGGLLESNGHDVPTGP